MYVIAGVSGNTGSIVASQLLAAKKPVRVIVRDAAKGEAWRARGAEVAVADLEDQAALTRALTGATAAYLLLPPTAWSQGGIAADRARKTAAIAGALRAARPGHLVLLSSIAAELPSGTGPIRFLHTLENAVRDLGIPTTFLRAGAFIENWAAQLPAAVAGGALYHALEATTVFPQVAVEDIGKTAARLLLEGPPASSPRIVELAGPADASLGDIVAAASRAAGKPIQAVTVPAAAMIDALVGQGASRELAEDYAEMAVGLNAGTIKFHGTPLRGQVTIDQRVKTFVA
ncbi:MAG TPA: NmrA family NAD(P)-binding protein [Kofleriaceae bacterium]|nr:NmrA family NAD(P)-binding protein [Kofleriaceae bacterium]